MKLGKNKKFVYLAIISFAVLMVLTNLPSDNIMAFTVVKQSYPKVEVVENITCYAKVTSTAQKGSVQNIQQSTMYEQKPFAMFGMNLIDNTGVKDSITSFKVDLKMRCKTVDGKPIQIQSTPIKLDVWSQDQSKNKVKTVALSSTTKPVVLTNNKEQVIGTFTVDPKTIENKIYKGKDFNSYHEFRVFGGLKMTTPAIPNANLIVTVSQDKVKTYFYTLISEAPTHPSNPTTCPAPTKMIAGKCELPVVCPEGTYRSGEQCIREAVCSDGYEMRDNICKKIDQETTSGTDNNDEEEVDAEIPENIIQEWVACSGDTTCLLQNKFMGGYIAIFVAIMITVAIGIITNRKNG